MPQLPRSVDVLVAGGGMAGLAAGAAATAVGAKVVVLEKGPAVGGSAALSAGIFWTLPDVEAYRRHIPLGDPLLGRVVVDGLGPAVDAVRAAGVAVSEPFGGIMRYGVGNKIDAPALLATLRARIEDGGGTVACGTAVRQLVGDPEGIAGAVVGPAAGRGGTTVAARAVVLATGGFQGDPELVAEHIGAAAARMPVRSNPHSTGDGLRMGLAAGAATGGDLASFYGHLVPSPLAEFPPAAFLPLTAYHSSHCLLVNLEGRRFCDESLGDEVNNQAVLAQPGARAVLLADERIRRAYAISAPYPHGAVVDRFAEAIASGGRHAGAGTIEELAARVAGWGLGIEAGRLRATVDGYAAAAAGDRVALAALDAPLPARPEPLTDPPFAAFEVQPTITFTYGGLRVDADCQVRRTDGSPLPGLFAAGADVGGLSNVAYAGGLAPAYITGDLAGQAAARAARVTVRSPAAGEEGML